MITLIALSATFMAIFIKARWAQTGAATVLAGLSTYFLIAASTLGTA